VALLLVCPVVLQVVTEQRLVEHSEAFESAVSGRDRAALQVRGSSSSSMQPQHSAATCSIVGTSNI
jgi:hypothetical protein